MIKILDLKDKPGYLSTLAMWHQNEWSHLNPGETLEHRTKRMQPYLNDDFIPSTFIAIDKTVLGSASIVENDMETRPELSPWLASVFVAPEHRNNCVGNKLVSHFMTQAKNKGIKKLYLFTADKKDFYEQLGWHTYNNVQYHGHQVTIMQVTLNND